MTSFCVHTISIKLVHSFHALTLHFFLSCSDVIAISLSLSFSHAYLQQQNTTTIVIAATIIGQIVTPKVIPISLEQLQGYTTMSHDSVECIPSFSDTMRR